MFTVIVFQEATGEYFIKMIKVNHEKKKYGNQKIISVGIRYQGFLGAQKINFRNSCLADLEHNQFKL